MSLLRITVAEISSVDRMGVHSETKAREHKQTRRAFLHPYWHSSTKTTTTQNTPTIINHTANPALDDLTILIWLEIKHLDQNHLWMIYMPGIKDQQKTLDDLQLAWNKKNKKPRAGYKTKKPKNLKTRHIQKTPPPGHIQKRPENLPPELSRGRAVRFDRSGRPWLAWQSPRLGHVFV